MKLTKTETEQLFAVIRGLKSELSVIKKELKSIRQQVTPIGKYYLLKYQQMIATQTG